MEADESIESVHEANLLSKLDNPYILKYYDSFLDGDYFCIVTEYCEVNLNSSFSRSRRNSTIILIFPGR